VSDIDTDRMVMLEMHGDRYRELVKSITIDMETWN
jgi:hypothetical protein